MTQISFDAHYSDINYIRVTLGIMQRKGEISTTEVLRLTDNLKEVQKFLDKMEQKYGSGYVEID